VQPVPLHASELDAMLSLAAEVFAPMFKFVFVRNPWDLQVSSWHHIAREKPQVVAGVRTFADFLKLKFDPERPFDYMLDISRELQSDYIVDLHGRTIVDFIGRYEHLQGDFDTACDRIAIPRVALPHDRRAVDRDDYRRYYDDATRALVAEHYAPDIERLGYTFE
jgi:hypothetical protein